MALPPLRSYTSMHQKDPSGARTPEEKASFGRALENMTIFYAHRLTTVYMMTRHPYEHGYPMGYDAEHPGCSQHVKLYAERGSGMGIERSAPSLLSSLPCCRRAC